MLRVYPLICIQLFLINVTLSQDFKVLPSIEDDLDDWYETNIGNSHSVVAKGIFYFKEQNQTISQEQNPFYKGNWDLNAVLHYEGRQVSNVRLIYNSTKDIVLVWAWDANLIDKKTLMIDQSRVDSFRVHNEIFLHDKHAEVGLGGFYRTVMKGKHVVCYAKELKSVRITKNGSIFKESKQYFLRYEDQTYTYRGMSSLSLLFPDLRLQIKRFKKAIPYSRDGKETRLQTLLFYVDSIVE